VLASGDVLVLKYHRRAFGTNPHGRHAELMDCQCPLSLSQLESLHVDRAFYSLFLVDSIVYRTVNFLFGSKLGFSRIFDSLYGGVHAFGLNSAAKVNRFG